MFKVWEVVTRFSLLLVAGAVLALMWANLAPESYAEFLHFTIYENFFVGVPHVGADGSLHTHLTLHFLVNDVGMAFFFAVAGKEVWEAIILPNGSLRGRRALTPLIATVGGMTGPICMYLLGAMLFGSTTFSAVSNGWAVPTATDIAFGYLVGRIVFGAGHPAVGFLLLLAIADDALGLLVLATFYPKGDTNYLWLLLSVGAAGGVYFYFNLVPRILDRCDEDRPCFTWVRKRLSGIPYAIAGAVSWYAFYRSGLHPALSFLPVVLTIPHAKVDLGVFAKREEHKTDLLNRLEHALKVPIQIILFFFGLMNAGVKLGAVGEATWLVFGGLLLGKPLGIFLFGWVAILCGLALPEGMNKKDLLVLGVVAGIGFTVALFVASVAFPPGVLQEAAKMGALLSFTAGGAAFVLSKVLRVKRVA